MLTMAAIPDAYIGAIQHRIFAILNIVDWLYIAVLCNLRYLPIQIEVVVA